MLDAPHQRSEESLSCPLTGPTLLQVDSCCVSAHVSVSLLGVRVRACSWVSVSMRVCIPCTLFPAQALLGSWAQFWTLGRRWPCQCLRSKGETPQVGDVAMEVARDKEHQLEPRG